MEEKPENQVGEVLEPLEQHTIKFYGKSLVVVRLPNGDPTVVLRYFCDNLKLALTGQIARVNRKKALASGLHYARIETAGGPQVMAVLTLKVTPGWLFGIDASRVQEDMRPEIERYQAECVDVLYEWASTTRLATPTNLVPAKPLTKPETPVQGASREQWRDYFLQMAEFTDWQISVEAWQGSVENRLESLEALVPDILERLPPPTITARHQNDVKHYVIELGKAANKHPQTIWSMVYTAFQVPTYKDLREADWDQIQQWFRAQFHKLGRVLPSDEQGRLF